MSKEYMEGRDFGFKHGMFENKNPYKPGTEQFEDWNSGFNAGCKLKEWL